MLTGKKILLGVTGSIAAYKAAVLVRLLVKEGAEVKVVMTGAAQEFISALTLSTLSKNKVLTDLVEENAWTNHVDLGRWADLMIIAPASCNTLSKMASGACDNLLSAVYLSATCTVMAAPAMDEDMWLHGSVKKNIALLKSYGNIIINVESGELASGLTGEGRMAEPEKLLSLIDNFFEKKKDLINQKVLISAGSTREPIDPVRFISNSSSGKMGFALASACRDRGANVTVVAGPLTATPPDGIEIVQVQTAAEMFEACVSRFSSAHITIMTAAVADYTPAAPAAQKIKKTDDTLTLSLTKTADILKHLGKLKKENHVLVGFALETENETANAQKKLKEKNADLVVLNSMRDAGAGFESDTNKITIFDRSGTAYSYGVKSKREAADDIIDRIIKLQNA